MVSGGRCEKIRNSNYNELNIQQLIAHIWHDLNTPYVFFVLFGLFLSFCDLLNPETHSSMFYTIPLQ